MKYQPNIIFYHHPCTDGLSSAAVAQNFYGTDGVSYETLDYGNPRETIDLINMCRDKHVLMIDCSFKAEDIEKVAQSANSITIIDHHSGVNKTLAQYDIGWMDLAAFEKWLDEDQPKIRLLFNNDHCGAVLAYMFLNPTKDVPVFLEYVQDNDLGRYQLPNTAKFRSFSRSIPYDIAEMRAVMEKYKTENDFKEIFKAGEAIDSYVNTRISVLLTQAKELYFPELGDIPYVITDYAFASDVANRLLDDVGYNLAIAFYFTASGMGASIRSQNGVDASEFARSFGGNGHKQAAGFNIPFSELPDFLAAISEYDNELFGPLFNG